jgi:3-deoxy-D-arabino-heptulosonate 7-phosphate (DAHP) synthase
MPSVSIARYEPWLPLCLVGSRLESGVPFLRATDGAVEVAAASMVSTAYLQRALPSYKLEAPPKIATNNGATHAYHIFRSMSTDGMGATERNEG